MTREKINQIIAYYTENNDNLITAIYLDNDFADEFSGGFGRSYFGIYDFGG